MTDFVQKVLDFNELGGNKTEFNPRMVELYIGLQLEEMLEKIEALPNHKSLHTLRDVLHTYSARFKMGTYTELVESISREEALDADVDLAVVALGGAKALGADVQGACHEVADSNMSKFLAEDGSMEVMKDENGKIMKGPKYFAPSLKRFLDADR